jgi:hypothetical protein
MKRVFPLLVLSLFAGCDDHHDPDEAFAHFANEFDDSAGDVEAMVADHHGDVMGAEDLPAMQRMEAGHREAMRAAMDEMGAVRRSMGMCTMHDMAPMDDAARAAADEVDRHSMAMREAADMPAARAEEQRHRGAMGERMMAMRGHRDAMMREGGDMRCPGMGEHVHGGGAPPPGDAPGAVGGACAADDECPAGGSGTPVCRADWPGGYCAVDACAAHGHDCPNDAGQAGASAGAKCVLDPEPVCLALCDDDADCREGYACTARPDAAGDVEPRVCVPR